MRKAAAVLGLDPLEPVVGRGKDFELLYSIPPGKVSRISGLNCHTIGSIVAGNEQPVILDSKAKREALIKGFDHLGTKRLSRDQKAPRFLK
jgi:thiamine monophosphate kinase